jgi:hypothetical protein
MFIDVSPLQSIELSKIEAIEILDNLNCMIYTASRSYRIAMPKEVVLSMIESKSQNVEKPSKQIANLENLLKQLLQGSTSPRI